MKTKLAQISIQWPSEGSYTDRFMRSEMELLARELEERFVRSATVTLAIAEAPEAPSPETPAATA